MSFFRKLFIITLLVIAFIAISQYASAAGSSNAAVGQYTCQKARCLAYNSNGTARYSTLLGITYRTFVFYQSNVYGSKGSTWLVQSMFLSQSVYYKAVDFVAAQ